ncbi:MAG TPA: AAA family ATPase, partial [Nitrosomonas sp.]|nr:AAA family ATPase [Nitrosomonas sp.]
MKTNDTPQPELIKSLMQPDVFHHPVKAIQLIETHISWVILTGDFAYKIKKPCNLGFLDFSTLQKRRFFCNEELRLNKRLAARIYLDIVKITGDPKNPVLNGTGKTIEYAIKMLQFSQQTQLDNMLADGKLENKHIDAFAKLVAKFHQNIKIAESATNFGNPQHVNHATQQIFMNIRACPKMKQFSAQLTKLELWHKSAFNTLTPLFEQRKHDGFIRECHGDMHLRNLVWLNNEPIAFDCLEFDPDLRWIDTLSEVAFLVMDLHDRKLPQLAQRFLNLYLEQCGDYSGLQVFRFYLVYRALVRAMVNAIRAAQSDVVESEKHQAENELQSYLKLALSYINPTRPLLIITRGLSASGKSTLSQSLLELIGAVRIRSDVERKRLFGVNSDHTTKSDINNGIYSAEATVKTYAKLKSLAESILNADYPVIIDAAFLKYAQRQSFQNLAHSNQIPFIILE